MLRWAHRAWYVAILAGLGVLLWLRLPHLAGTAPTAFDALLLALSAALAVAPLFQEVTVLGVSLKAKVKELETEVSAIRQIIQTTSTATVTLHNSPSPDELLPRIKEMILTEVLPAARTPVAIEAPLSTQVLAAGPAPSPTPLTEEQTARIGEAANMFDIRYRLEEALRNIFEAAIESDERVLFEVLLGRKAVGIDYLRRLVSGNVVPQWMEPGIRDIWAITSAGIHRGEVTDAQRKFVNDTADIIIGVLQQIGRNQAEITRVHGKKTEA